MFKTENGNNQITLEEFKDKLKVFNPIVDDETSKETYEEIKDMLIGTIEVAQPGTWAYQDSIRYVKSEARDKWLVLYVHLSYDVGRYDLCPQDMPYTLLLFCKYDGEVRTLNWVRDFIKKQGGVKNEHK